MKRSDSVSGLSISAGSGSNASAPGLRRTFSSSAKRRCLVSSTSGGAVTVAAQQFVFGSGASTTGFDEGSQSQFGNGAGSDSRGLMGSSRASAAMASRMAAPAGSLLRTKSFSSGGGEGGHSSSLLSSSSSSSNSSLFAQLTARAGSALTRTNSSSSLR